MMDCRVPAPEPRPHLKLNGTIFPASNAPSTEYIGRLTDGMVNIDTASNGYGLRTAAAAAPYITIDLGQVYLDFGGVGGWL